jgi:hypothetical protein
MYSIIVAKCRKFQDQSKTLISGITTLSDYSWRRGANNRPSDSIGRFESGAILKTLQYRMSGEFEIFVIIISRVYAT